MIRVPSTIIRLFACSFSHRPKSAVPGNRVIITNCANLTPAFSANNTGAAVATNEFTMRCQQIVIQGVKSNAGTGVVNNTGNVYVMLKGNGTSNRTDFGAMVLIVAPGATAVIASAPFDVNVFNPHKFFLDADTAGDSALITMIVQ